MIQEEKQILLVDLSARLSYGVICHTEKGDGHLCSINQTIFDTEYGVNIKATKREYFNDRKEVIKPYLRSMSSITEEEKEKLRTLKWTKLEHYTVDWLNKKMFDYRGLIEKGLAIAVTKENNPYKE